MYRDICSDARLIHKMIDIRTRLHITEKKKNRITDNTN